MAKNNKPMTNQQKRDWLKANSEKLVSETFINLEDNLKMIRRDYKVIYNELIANLTKEIESQIINGEIVSPLMMQNKFVQIVQLAVNQLTLLDVSHETYLKKLLRSYHTSITEYQIGLIKSARDSGVLFSHIKLNETALHMALQFPYAEYNFSKGLADGTFKVGNRLNKLLVNKVFTGESIAKLIPKIEEAFEIKTHVAERIARTETSRVLNQATLNVYKQAGLDKVQWLDSTEAIKGSTIKKALVCSECRQVATHNGGIYPINEIPQIPLHPHCRCTVIPVLE